ncbi:hypothetical protein SDJN03_26763, partial [Cucurbita argyrosperma subsp. sororia]
MGFFKKLNFARKNRKPVEQEFEAEFGFEKGVQSVQVEEDSPELIRVTGVFEVQKLVAHIRRGVDKIVTVIKQENAAGGGSGDGEQQIEDAPTGGSPPDQRSR